MKDDLTSASDDGALTASDWAGASGERWLANLDSLERMIEPIGTALLSHAGYRQGESVVDIGCGGGWTTRQIARAVGPEGGVVGVDISPVLIGAARERARDEEIANIAFEVADAASVMPAGAPFDRLFSRFGSMFFAVPYAAFANLRRMLVNGGRLDIAVWAPPGENPWFTAMMSVLARHVELPPPVPRAPGPFALGETDYVRDLLGNAGFDEPDIIAWEGTQYIGGRGNGAEEAASFTLESLHIGDLIKNLDPSGQAAVRDDLIRMFAGRETPEGVGLPSKALFVTAYAGRTA
ncbi:class I SAM-dependent methyltransferase [Sphingobium yanoikuyae]|uniref:Class I SAM-dependent methyltransferase n=2 Tax=Sphingomonadaceae TaxID=41297 RepID=A0AA42WVB6_SPHYA|nr:MULTISPECIES: class I SAM-dependent methyltransferase [Sphingomonadales]MEA3387774.1 class I SAM-dependent methyltransferase [Pseudomonadota bacterium]MBM7405062.1 SAM-dependent methyltransferase [Sphingomonas sp. JUb134]MDH2132398.1 class I SAM-dependent methyltransferase [Sphingobium yanoikuyae]MDH2152095.1 class I SAM-dependent methyltransferase [Sphingobium yanoikuyae]MDH2167858.1 class I SAM-dependent methyltransferase [Sphingobium yanoikuyae]